METIKAFIANTAVRWFKNLGVFGRQRFWVLYWAYRLTGWHIRAKEWDFVLEYLSPLMKGQQVKILDVGCARNLFCFEVVGRGYNLQGLDLELPVKYFPALCFRADIRQVHFVKIFNFITCISVLEHIKTGKENALRNMINALIVGGRLLLTIPTKEFAQCHPWGGFTCKSLEALLPKNCVILQYTERAGQICCAVERTE